MSGGDPERAALDQRVLSWLREPGAIDATAGASETRFTELALALFAFQFSHCTPYRRFCQARGITPADVSHWRDVPAVPTGAFKEVALRCFPPAREVHVFRTSGTNSASGTGSTSGTSSERRGALHLDTLALYEASLLPNFQAHVLPDAERRPVALHALAPDPARAPDSSLSHMFATVLRDAPLVGGGFELEPAGWDVRIERLEDLARAEHAVALCGTSFAFVHWLDALDARGRTIRLPEGSRIMETGGFKGRSREVDRAALHRAIARGFGVPAERIVNQYGMTELGSQFYDSVLRRPDETRRKLPPPWTRVRLVDPTSGRDVPPGEPGVIVIVDLANTGSVQAVQTADLGRAVEDGFEVLGREPGAEARGCSIAADVMLAEGP